MKRAAAVLAFIVLSALAARADTTFFTENWSGPNSNWNVLAGTPYRYYFLLRNSQSDLSTETRLLYSGTLQIQDYSVQTALSCGLALDWYIPSFFHYLRASGGNYYKVEAWYSPPDPTLTIRLCRIGSPSSVLLGWTSASCGTLKTSIIGSNISVSMNGTTILSASDSTFTSGSLGGRHGFRL